MITAGAASAITVATAAAMTKGDPKKIAQLPETEGLPFEVLSYGSDGEPGGQEDAADISSADI